MSTALIRLAATDDEAPICAAAGRPRADFLAQLIATAGQAPQTRMRRRAEPGEAIAAYRAGGRLPALVGHALAYSL